MHAGMGSVRCSHGGDGPHLRNASLKCSGKNTFNQQRPENVFVTIIEIGFSNKSVRSDYFIPCRVFKLNVNNCRTRSCSMSHWTLWARSWVIRTLTVTRVCPRIFSNEFSLFNRFSFNSWTKDPTIWPHPSPACLSHLERCVDIHCQEWHLDFCLFGLNIKLWAIQRFTKILRME